MSQSVRAHRHFTDPLLLGDSPQMSRVDAMKAAVHECVSSCTVM